VVVVVVEGGGASRLYMRMLLTIFFLNTMWVFGVDTDQVRAHAVLLVPGPPSGLRLPRPLLPQHHPGIRWVVLIVDACALVFILPGCSRFGALPFTHHVPHWPDFELLMRTRLTPSSKQDRGGGLVYGLRGGGVGCTQ
jgi:hypothetical protein